MIHKNNITYLLLGSNLADRSKNLAKAHQMIAKQVGTIIAQSAVYESTPWGGEEVALQPDYLNQAIAVRNTLAPQALLKTVKNIEQEMGRVNAAKNAERIIDIDIILMGNLVLETPSLTIPHQSLPLRNFALIPLMEIAPFEMHPKLGITIEELYEKSKDQTEVLLYEE